MNRHLHERHLREEDICRWIAGERTQETKEHLGSCGQCRSHLAQMSEVLGGFHDSVRDRSEQRLARYGAFPLGASRAVGWGKLPMAALVTLFVAVAAWLLWHSWKSARVPETKSRVVDVPVTDDAALLKRIDAEVSRTVPGPMEPLAALIELRPESQQSVQSPQDSRER